MRLRSRSLMNNPGWTKRLRRGRRERLKVFQQQVWMVGELCSQRPSHWLHWSFAHRSEHGCEFETLFSRVGLSNRSEFGASRFEVGRCYRRRCNGIVQVASGVMTPVFQIFRLSCFFERGWATCSSSLFTLLVAQCRMLRPGVLQLRTKSDCGWPPINPRRFRVLGTWKRNTGISCVPGSQKKTGLVSAVNHELDMDLDVAWHCPLVVRSVLAGFMLARS